MYSSCSAVPSALRVPLPVIVTLVLAEFSLATMMLPVVSHFLNM